MRWFEVVARICKFFGQYRMIMDREGIAPYLHRYYLFSTRWISRWKPEWSYRVVLHHCVQSDADGLHDHPWEWWSKILAGGYWEYLPEGKVWRGPGSFRHSSAYQYHRLVLPHDGASCWSLFIMGPKDTKDHNEPWGFQDKDGNWVRWDEYIENRHLYI